MRPMALVLIIEDELTLAQTLELYLRRENFKTERAGDGRRALELTPTEFGLLHHLAKTPGRAVSRSELYAAAMPESGAFERAVDIHITNLRRKLREAGAHGPIETVRGLGYRLASA